jgi:AraC-like DNA-binding protein
MPQNKFSLLLENMLSDYCDVCFSANNDSNDDLLLSFEPDIILADGDFVEDGLCLFGQLKNNIGSAHIFTVVLVGDPKSQELYLKAGADFCIIKPRAAANLAIQLRNLLHTQQSYVSRLKAVVSLKEPKSKRENDMEISLDRLESLVHKHIDNAEFGVNTLCRELKIPHWQLYRRIKDLTGCTIREFIRVQRIKASAYKVVEQKFTISEIAYMVGFSNPSYFTQCFKQLFGCTPSEFAVQKTEVDRVDFFNKSLWSGTTSAKKLIRHSQVELV